MGRGMTSKQREEIRNLIIVIKDPNECTNKVCDYFDELLGESLTEACEFGEILNTFDLEIRSKK
jgi:hypothetical protein